MVGFREGEKICIIKMGFTHYMCSRFYLYGTAFPAIRMGLESYTPEHLTLLRLLIASFILLLFSFIYKLRLPDLKDIPAILYLVL